jgi:hypothetical protein
MNAEVDFFPLMERKVEMHAKNFDKYEPGINAEAVMNSLKVKRSRTASDICLSGAHLWKRFREIKRIIINDIIPIFMKAMEKRPVTPSGKNLSLCLLETRKILYMSRKKSQERSSSSTGEDQTDMPASWYPAEWLVFVNMGPPVAYSEDTANHSLVCPDFRFYQSAGMHGFDQNPEEDVKNLSRKRQRFEASKANSRHDRETSSFQQIEMHERVCQVVEKKSSERARSAVLSAFQAEIEARKALYTMAKEMGNEVGMQDAYHKLEIATNNLESLLAGCVTSFPQNDQPITELVPCFQSGPSSSSMDA